ncbi:MAG: energy transducer TonB [Pyrinomonadaceae bacterium]
MLTRVLPFTLTLFAGLLLASFVHNFRSLIPSLGQAQTAKLELRSTRRNCHSMRSRRNFAENNSHVVVTFKPPALYTQEARRKLTSGVVRLNVLYGADGSVLDAVPLLTLPYGLTQEAIAAAKRTQFIPARICGDPTPNGKLRTLSSVRTEP